MELPNVTKLPNVNTETRNHPKEGQNDISTVHICRNSTCMNLRVGTGASQFTCSRAGICMKQVEKVDIYPNCSNLL